MRGTSLPITTKVSFRGTRMKQTFLRESETAITLFVANFCEKFEISFSFRKDFVINISIAELYIHGSDGYEISNSKVTNLKYITYIFYFIHYIINSKYI